MRIRCLQCGKSVSTEVPEDTVIRAWIECPECTEAKEKSDAPNPIEFVRRRGARDCYQDDCENCKFSSIGGEGKRNAPEAPDYIKPEHRAAYLEGYTAEAERLYGEDWRTCEFHWMPALTIGDKEETNYAPPNDQFTAADLRLESVYYRHYGHATQAMLLAGAAAMEERDRLRKELDGIVEAFRMEEWGDAPVLYGRINEDRKRQLAAYLAAKELAREKIQEALALAPGAIDEHLAERAGGKRTGK